MENQLFNEYKDIILKTNFNSSTKELPKELLMDSLNELEIYYAPFDYINKNVKVVICGITPGYQQAELALKEFKRSLLVKDSNEKALKLAKNTASFAGVMRTNLVKMLDFAGLHHKLKLSSTSELFSSASDLVHYTSALRYPVFRDGKNYSGSPSMVNNSMLRKQLDSYLIEEVKLLPRNAIYIPLGPKVSDALRYVCDKGVLESAQVLNGLPHPSGANAERIAFFLDKKSKDNLSKKTNPEIILSARNKILEKIGRLS